MSPAHSESVSSVPISVPFVGRQAELERLCAVRQSVLQDGGRVVLLTGEAGAGKTRLAEEFGEQVRQEGDLFLRGRAVELQGTDPYRPLVEVLQNLLGGDPDASASRRQERLDGQLLCSGAGSGGSSLPLWGSCCCWTVSRPARWQKARRSVGTCCSRG